MFEHGRFVIAHSKPRSVCVFCGSNRGASSVYAEAAERLGHELAARGIGLVYGGGNVGLMGVVADAVLSRGGHVTGIIPEALSARELAHRGIQDLIVVGSMHERKAKMADLADAFVMMPGGFGTFEEFCEVLTWAQLGIHTKACAALDVNGYYAPLFAMFDHAVAEGFVSPAHRSGVLRGTTAEEVLDAIERFVPTASPKWIDRTQT